ncbi:hypothetical protein Afil01_05910 [Actinorhabdospora filicis]|uniref:MucB/RseB N-terminal domain-containing protein n=1 Tax=Actinorhabdospora filicis TaxID=1785913 RepID=A0A9W6W6Q1_9ACTN|nr:outer membrane lipoprotein carrier protein LolA [Actinorhabdospora filicis]GLZ75784.1 hypothetical protein Afil01_05910 [Actinorhabdospora filicis]
MTKTATLRRWAVPAAIGAAVVATGVGATLVQAGNGPSLPAKTAAELLTDVQNSSVQGLSGTVVTSADLGLPALPGVGGGGGADVASLLGGSQTMRIWYAAPDKVRAAVLGSMGESDIIRNGSDVWSWNSQEQTATHTTLDPQLGSAPMWPPRALAGEPVTPQKAAEEALAAISGTTEVTTDGTAEVAGRDAYELVLAPKDKASTIAEVRLAVDAETGVPLRTRVMAAGKSDPAFEIAFARISFEVPPAEHFTFTPPQGTKVTESTQPKLEESKAEDVENKGDLKVVGEGWTAVAVLTNGDFSSLLSGKGEEWKDAPAEAKDGLASAQTFLTGLPQVSGAWGSGRVFTSTLVNALITDDGRILIGAVTVDKLVEVAGR